MPWRENKGVANLNGFRRIFFSCRKARNLLRKSFLSIARAQEIYSITREPKSLNKNP